jgi:hypothetical protein
MSCARGIRENGRRRCPAVSAEDGGGPAGARVHGGVTRGNGDGDVRARASSGGGGLRRLGLGMTAAPNRYDGWDQRVSVASDEPTLEKYERRSNRRCNAAPG